MKELDATQHFLVLLSMLSLLTFGVSGSSQNPRLSQTPAEGSLQGTAQLAGRQLGQPSFASHLSEPYRSISFPSSFQLNPHQPVWGNGYLAQLVEGAPTADVVVYDKDGRLASQAHVGFPEATQVLLFTAAPTASGGAIVSGQASIFPGIRFFLAKTSVSGGVASVLWTDSFFAGPVCEGSDGTVWTLGQDPKKESERDGNYSLVRQYSFEKGLLNSYLPRNSVAFRHNRPIGGGGPSGAFLVCGNDFIALYFNQTAEFMEIDPLGQGLKRWKMPTPLSEGRVQNLAVTRRGGVYASLFEERPEAETKSTRGLFELQKSSDGTTGKWLVVGGTLNSYREESDLPQNSFWRLWGADGNDLVIHRLYDADLAWVRVVP